MRGHDLVRALRRSSAVRRVGTVRQFCNSKTAGARAANQPASDRLFTVGNVVCGLAVVGTVGGAVNFLADFPEPCQIAVAAAEQVRLETT